VRTIPATAVSSADPAPQKGRWAREKAARESRAAAARLPVSTPSGVRWHSRDRAALRRRRRSPPRRRAPRPARSAAARRRLRSREGRARSRAKDRWAWPRKAMPRQPGQRPRRLAPVRGTAPIDRSGRRSQRRTMPRTAAASAQSAAWPAMLAAADGMGPEIRSDRTATRGGPASATSKPTAIAVRFMCARRRAA